MRRRLSLKSRMRLSMTRLAQRRTDLPRYLHKASSIHDQFAGQIHQGCPADQCRLASSRQPSWSPFPLREARRFPRAAADRLPVPAGSACGGTATSSAARERVFHSGSLVGIVLRWGFGDRRFVAAASSFETPQYESDEMLCRRFFDWALSDWLGGRACELDRFHAVNIGRGTQRIQSLPRFQSRLRIPRAARGRLVAPDRVELIRHRPIPKVEPRSIELSGRPVAVRREIARPCERVHRWHPARRAAGGEG